MVKQKQTRKTRRNQEKNGKNGRHTYKPLLPGLEHALCHPRVRGKTRRCLPPNIRQRLGNTTAQEDEKALVQASTTISPSEKKEILKTYFRPDMPKEWYKDSDMWLSNEDIEAVMRQYEEAYPHFRFLGVTPVDFAAPNMYGDKSKCLNEAFCKVRLQEEAKKGITLVGAVFNLDHHLKNGSHWVAAAIDLKKHTSYYFDSYGFAPPNQIARFLKVFKLQDPKLHVERNGRRFQYGSSECGVYSMYFLIRMIAGDDFLHFVRRPIADKDIREFRKQLFYVSKGLNRFPESLSE